MDRSPAVWGSSSRPLSSAPASKGFVKKCFLNKKIKANFLFLSHLTHVEGLEPAVFGRAEAAHGRQHGGGDVRGPVYRFDERVLLPCRRPRRRRRRRRRRRWAERHSKILVYLFGLYNHTHDVPMLRSGACAARARWEDRCRTEKFLFLVHFVERFPRAAPPTSSGPNA